MEEREEGEKGGKGGKREDASVMQIDRRAGCSEVATAPQEVVCITV